MCDLTVRGFEHAVTATVNFLKSQECDDEILKQEIVNVIEGGRAFLELMPCIVAITARVHSFNTRPVCFLIEIWL